MNEVIVNLLDKEYFKDFKLLHAIKSCHVPLVVRQPIVHRHTNGINHTSHNPSVETSVKPPVDRSL